MKVLQLDLEIRDSQTHGHPASQSYITFPLSPLQRLKGVYIKGAKGTPNRPIMTSLPQVDMIFL